MTESISVPAPGRETLDAEEAQSTEVTEFGLEEHHDDISVETTEFVPLDHHDGDPAES